MKFGCHNTCTDMYMYISVVVLMFLGEVKSQAANGFFNQSSVAYLSTSWDVRQTLGFSFRTCSLNGELLFQSGASGDFLKLKLTNGTLEFQFRVGGAVSSIFIGSDLANNLWYNIEMNHIVGKNNLKISQGSRTSTKVLANSTFNQQLLNVNIAGGTNLTVGQTFVGCLNQGRGVMLSLASSSTGVLWGQCPLQQQVGCSPVDTNPCAANPCVNGDCLVEGQSYRCDCPVIYNGTHCDNYIGNLGCAIRPCQNNATCSPRTTDTTNPLPFECGCVAGYTGTYCETNIDDCLLHPQACLINGGRCVDGINRYICNCSGTGYEGDNCTTDVNECLTLSSPCGEEGTCRNLPGSFSCDCSDGFFGIPCQRIIACNNNSPCRNGGACENVGAGYKCACALGYTGTHCETTIDQCMNVTCPGEHVICESLVTSYRCTCQPGYMYRGAPGSCQEIDECALNNDPCVNGGTCNDLIDAYRCDCPEGYNGTNCENNINECANNPCEERGSCQDGVGDFTCTCKEGYRGKTCSENIDECLESVGEACQNGGECNDQIGGITCVCIPGYTGYYCETNINECDPQPCLNGATCNNRLNNYTCDCTPGYTGQNCSIDIDDCSPDPCQNGGVCNDGVNKFNCTCTTEWMGNTCSEEYDACSFSPCKNNATCTSTLRSQDYTCACLSGYTGANCETNINDCEGVVCLPYEECFDGLNSHTCGCPIGFSGENCSVDVNECAGSPCRNNGSCHDGLGFYKCNCEGSLVNLTRFMRPGESLVFNTGFSGTNCENDIDECQITPSICLNGGQCENSIGSFTCLCPNRDNVLFTGSYCELTTDYCLLSEEVKRDPPACKNNGTCKAHSANYTCECAPGFEGRRCEIDINECDLVREKEHREPCENNGTCHDGINGYTCECIPGITGVVCEVNINDCAPNPCQNGGRCKDGVNMYTCVCRDTGFEGVNCTEDIDDCLGNPCQNGAQCHDKIKDYNCSCFAGFSGKNCEEDVKECDADPCLNGGTCFERSLWSNYPDNPIPGNFSYDTAGGYYCRCRQGFNGSSCEVNINECLEVAEPCFNGGTCADGNNSYSCSCADGFHGDRCETEINECLSFHPCRNGATCQDRVADYFCECLPSLNRVVYGGKNCTTVLTGCEGNLCQNDATCVPVLVNEEQNIHDYNCSCAPGWDGQRCHSDTSASFLGSSFIYQQTQVRKFSQRFRTSLQDGVVNMIGSTSNNFITVEFQAGKLCIHSNSGASCLTMSLNDGAWHAMALQLHDRSVSLLLDDDSLCTGQSCSVHLNISTSLEDVTFGGVGIFNDVTQETLSKQNFIGCLQDMKVDTLSVPINSPSSGGVTDGCERQEQCLQNTCSGRGACTDLWFSSSCQCDRPYYGMACEEEIPGVTFSPGNEVSLVSFQPSSENLRTNLKLSLFFTTRTPDGMMFFMGGQLDTTGQSCPTDCNYFLLRLQSGHLCMKYRVCTQEQEHCSTQGIAYNDGQVHFLEVDRKPTSVYVLVDGIAMFDLVQFVDAGVLCRINTDIYFGSLPGLSARRRKRRQTRNPNIYANMTNFKGVIQDVRMNGDLLLFHPLSTQDNAGLPTQIVLQNGTDTTREGVVNDDVCGATNPCRNNATCENMFYNDYNCSCPEGFAGKNCDFEDRCLSLPCPGNSTCHSLQGGYECVTSATFRQGENGLQYQRVSSQNSDINTVSLRLRTREESGVIISLRNQQRQQSEFVLLELVGGAVQLTFNMGTQTRNLTSVVVVNDGTWHDVALHQFPGGVLLSVDKQVTNVDDNSVGTFASLISGTTVGHVNSTNLFLGADQGMGSNFIGCLDEVRINNIILPFYSDAELQIPTSNNASERFSLISQSVVSKGCNSEPVCEAVPRACKNGGTCHDLWNQFRCDCALGYDGDTCDNNIDDCANHDCQNGASCEDGLNNITCQCIPGFYGWRCEAQTNECEGLPCLNEGMCIDEVNDFSCNCTSNYTGKVCDILITETCDRMPCENGATCQDYNVTISGQEVARFNCTCAPGYEGRICDQEIDYCAEFPCKYGGTCISNVTILDYRCTCTPGFTDKDCGTEINECDSNPCKNGATCNDFINAYNCSCADGWQGFNCDEDIKECNQTVNPCGEWGICKELEGSYECLCDPGFAGKPCEDIDECDIGQCKNGAGCNNSIGDYSCNCTLGYEGKDCDMPNCSHSQCLMNSTCEIVQSSNTWRCDCLEYYAGVQCEIEGPCVSRPCQNGAPCEQNVTAMSYTCHCLPGFKGDNCEQDRNECEEDNPCENNSTCNNTFGSYQCFCAPGFTGTNCEININECDPNPCENGGLCEDLVDGFECDCTDTGYEGPVCSEDIDECEISAPCQHGATCINLAGGFECSCAEGYQGDFCETAKATGVSPDNIGIIVGSILGFLVLVAIICLIVFIVLARNKRATRGTYSPSRQEMSGSRVELGHVIKPPPEERLI